MTRERTPDERRSLRAARAAIALLGVAAAALAGFGAVLALGGQTQLEGTLLAVAAGCASAAFVLGARHVVPHERGVEEREFDAEGWPGVVSELKHGGPRYGRRGFLGLLAGVPLGLFGTAAVLRALGIGPREGQLFHTAWRAGVRLVRETGDPVRVDELEPGAIVTVLPEGRLDQAASQTLLIRVDPDRLRLEPARLAWAPDGHVAYSKACTHAGCPVGLYQVEVHELLCPCHQARFAVLEGARPVFGPAARPLPQLPLDVDGEGFLVAAGDYPEPVGPAFWHRDR